MATISAASGSGPVKVRNLSSSGALIEGAVLPSPGVPVRLSRGSLTVTGEIVWHRDGRAGLHFEASIVVPDWLPNGKNGAGQQRVDELVQEAKRAGPTWRDSEGAEAHSRSPTAAELLDLRAALVSLAEDLAGETAVVERHSSKLQTLDIAAQLLAKLAARALPASPNDRQL